MESFLAKIAWKMNIIAPGSPVHIGILLLTVLLSVHVYRIAREKDSGLLKLKSPDSETEKRKTRKISFLPAVGLLLCLMEVLKQIFLTYVRGWNYSWSDFPFQLCSIPMYLMLIYPILKERGRRTVESFLMTFGMIGGMAALIEPVSVFSDYVLLTVHSLIWHVLLVLIGVWMIADRKNVSEETNIKEARTEETGIKEARPQNIRLHPVKGLPGHLPGHLTKHLPDYLSEYARGAGLLYLCLAACAVAINTCLLRISGGTANMFFLGPSWPDMYILNDVYNHCGWEAETLLFMAVTWSAGLAVSILECLY